MAQSKVGAVAHSGLGGNSQGIDGTAMPSFASLPEADRWALAFYLGKFSLGDDKAKAGQKVWEENVAVRAQLPSLDALSRTTETS